MRSGAAAAVAVVEQSRRRWRQDETRRSCPDRSMNLLVAIAIAIAITVAIITRAEPPRHPRCGAALDSMLTFYVWVFWFSFGFVRGLSNLFKDDGTSGFFRREEGVFVFLRKVFWRGRKEGWMVSSVLRGERAQRTAAARPECVWSASSLSPTHPHPHAHRGQRRREPVSLLCCCCSLFFFFSSAARVGRKTRTTRFCSCAANFPEIFSSATAGGLAGNKGPATAFDQLTRPDPPHRRCSLACRPARQLRACIQPPRAEFKPKQKFEFSLHREQPRNEE